MPKGSAQPMIDEQLRRMQRPLPTEAAPRSQENESYCVACECTPMMQQAIGHPCPCGASERGLDFLEIMCWDCGQKTGRCTACGKLLQ